MWRRLESVGCTSSGVLDDDGESTAFSFHRDSDLGGAQVGEGKAVLDGILPPASAPFGDEHLLSMESATDGKTALQLESTRTGRWLTMAAV